MPWAQVYQFRATYALIYKNGKDAKKGKALVDSLWWEFKTARTTKQLHAPLPPDIVKRAEAKLNSITAEEPMR